LSRHSLGDGGWFVLFAFGKLKSRAFHAHFVFPFQITGISCPLCFSVSGSGKNKAIPQAVWVFIDFGRAKKMNKKYLPGSAEPFRFFH
jgi:hypothetical protein